MDENEKYCNNCKAWKKKELFSKDRRKKDGLQIYCKECMKQRNKEYRESNKEKIQAGKIRYRETHKEKIRDFSREYKSREKVKQRSKEYAKMYYKRKYNEDSLHRFKALIRSEIYSSFKRKNYLKSNSTENIIGCSITELIAWLKETYQNNYGEEYDESVKVHIDHIIPLSTATNEDEVKALCHYTNLQLLKAKDNLLKSNKLDWMIEKEGGNENKTNKIQECRTVD